MRIEGTITRGTTKTAFSVDTDYGWQQWQATTEEAAVNVDLLDALSALAHEHNTDEDEDEELELSAADLIGEHRGTGYGLLENELLDLQDPDWRNH